MSNMFLNARSVVNLDLSGWDTGRVTGMQNMFGDTHSLTILDVSGWDMSNVTNTNSMFVRTAELRILTLGEGFRFGNSGLPAVRATSEFTGFWQNVENGTVENPLGEHVLTSAELMAQFNGATMADTWVWQPVITE